MAEVSRGIVTANRLNVRSEPSAEGAVLGQFEKGADVDVFEDLDGWLRVRLGDGEGFVSSVYVVLQTETRMGHVTASSLNLRDAPNGERIGSLDEGAEVAILEEADGWFEVVADGTIGWVSKEYVAEEAEKAPAEEAASKATEEGFRIEGRDVWGPNGTRFARTYKLGVFSSGETSIGEYVAANRSVFLDLTESRLNVMQAVSKNEGNLEAINTWDNSFLTFGAFQWTVGTGNGPGELAALMDRLQHVDGDVFGELFGQYGLGVVDLVAAESEPPRGYLSLQGETLKTPAQKEGLRSLSWAYRFKLSGEHDVMRRVEIAHAASRVDLFYRSDQKAIRGKHIAEYVTSEYGVALLLDQHVNRPGHVPRTLAGSVEKFLEENSGADDPASWTDAEEARLLEIYVDLRNGTSMTDAQARADRTRQAVVDGVASDARGSYQGWAF
ncbi:MAG: SH3 domain-containing protein [bacterium]|nr:SH3 domain-containing protein [bacterium]